MPKGKKQAKTLVRLERLRMEYVPTDRLRPNEYNPNRQTEEEFALLVRSIREDGFTQPIVAQRDGAIVDGEHRWRAAKELKLAQVPVVFVDMGDVQRRVATLRHNRARGNEDVVLLSQMLKDLEQSGAIDQVRDALQMSDEEVERLLAYGGSVLDTFAGDTPSLAWEPRQTEPGQVEPFASPDGAVVQHVSVAAATPVSPSGTTSTIAPRGAAVPGLSAASHSPPLARRVFIMLESEAKIVDKALGPRASETLIAICKEKLHHAKR